MSELICKCGHSVSDHRRDGCHIKLDRFYFCECELPEYEAAKIAFLSEQRAAAIAHLRTLGAKHALYLKLSREKGSSFATRQYYRECANDFITYIKTSVTAYRAIGVLGVLKERKP